MNAKGRRSKLFLEWEAEQGLDFQMGQLRYGKLPQKVCWYWDIKETYAMTSVRVIKVHDIVNVDQDMSHDEATWWPLRFLYLEGVQ